MGLLRKTLILGSGGLAPIKSQSYKERSAKAAEKQVKLQMQAAAEARRAATPRYNVQCPNCKAQLTAPAGDHIKCPKCRGRMKVTPRASAPATAAPRADDVAAQIERLAALRRDGALTEGEFVDAKAKVLGSGETRSTK